MRLPSSKMVPSLSKKVRDILYEFSKSRTVAAFLIIRSTIVLLAAESKTNQEIAESVKMHPNSIALWRTRFIEALEILSIMEEEKPEDLKDLIIKVLKDLPRIGAPLTYDNAIRCKIKLIACQDPSDYGFTLSNWSLSSLRLAIINSNIVENISTGAIYHILKTADIRPWKIRYYLHSKEKYEDYDTYAAKIKAINAIYAEARQLAGDDSNSDILTFCTDEMTGIQALEHAFPDKATQPGMDAKQEFNYIRHGTTTLCGFFNVVTGKMEDPFLNATRTENDFVAALDQVISQNPDKTYRFVLDNLNIHMSESLVLYVAKKINFQDDLGEKGKSGILKNKQTRAAFLADTSHRICFYYVPIHCSWMNQIEIWFGIISRQLLRRRSFNSVEELEQCIRDFIIQYNKYFAHPFKWKYNSVPKRPEAKDQTQENDSQNDKEQPKAA